MVRTFGLSAAYCFRIGFNGGRFPSKRFSAGARLLRAVCSMRPREIHVRVYVSNGNARLSRLAHASTHLLAHAPRSRIITIVVRLCRGLNEQARPRALSLWTELAPRLHTRAHTAINKAYCTAWALRSRARGGRRRESGGAGTLRAPAATPGQPTNHSRQHIINAWGTPISWCMHQSRANHDTNAQSPNRQRGGAHELLLSYCTVYCLRFRS